MCEQEVCIAECFLLPLCDFSLIRAHMNKTVGGANIMTQCIVGASGRRFSLSHHVETFILTFFMFELVQKFTECPLK